MDKKDMSLVLVALGVVFAIAYNFIEKEEEEEHEIQMNAL